MEEEEGALFGRSLRMTANQTTQLSDFSLTRTQVVSDRDASLLTMTGGLQVRSGRLSPAD